MLLLDIFILVIKLVIKFADLHLFIYLVYVFFPFANKTFKVNDHYFDGLMKPGPLLFW